MKITSINAAIVDCELHQAFLEKRPDLNHLFGALASFSRRNPATLFAFDVVTQDKGKVSVKRYYASNGYTEVVDASFKPSSLKPAVIILHAVTIMLPNGIIDVEVMAPEDALQNELEYLAYQQIKAWEPLIQDVLSYGVPW